MKKVLIFGGTRFFGETTVTEYLNKGYNVTIATRGKTSHSFGDAVTQIIVDRTDDSHEGWDLIQSQKWDVVFDNICFTKEDAQLAIDKLEGKTGYYLLTSTLAVYEGEKNGYLEADFNPHTYALDPSLEVTYAEGKRQAEATFAQNSSFKLGILRIPIVLGVNDYTERLHYYVRKAVDQETIVLHDPNSEISFIQASDAVRVIVWMTENEKEGTYNASSVDALPLKTFISWLEEGTDTQAQVEYDSTQDKPSPFSLPHTYYLKTEKIQEEGVSLPQLASWLKPLIRTLYSESKKD